MAEVDQMHTAQSQDGTGVGELDYLQALQQSLKRSPTRLLELCAPEPFHFRVKHRALGCITGFAVYMPVAEGMETKDLILLHRGSVAFCFWKGRQMPYASLDSLLPFMTKGTGVAGSSAADGKKLKERVRLMLFFGTVAEVDDCKFKFNDDIEEQLHPSRRRVSGAGGQVAVDPYTDFQQWSPAAKKWTRGGASNISKVFEDWLKTSSSKYDRTCELSDEIKGEARKQLEVDYGRKVGAGNTKEGPWHTFGRVRFGTSFSMMDVKQGEQVLFAPTNLKIESSYTGAVKTKKLVGTALYFEVDSGALSGSFAATCDVIVRREPAELYGQIYSIRCSLLQSKSAGECKNVLVSERTKAPSKLFAAFKVTVSGEPVASGEDMAEGTKDKPLEVAAGEKLQISAVRATNAEGKEIVNWLRPTGKDCGALRFKQSVLHGFGQGGRQGQAVEGYLDTTHKSGCGRVGETDMKVTLSPRPSPDPTLLLNLP